MRTLSKSDFKAARECGTKLYYKERDYPSTRDESELLELLADGGYMVEHLAKLLFPDGIALEYVGSSEASARETRRHLEAESVTLFEATLLAGNKLARADILVKRGDRFELIEVKAKSFDSSGLPAGAIGELPRNRNGSIPADWRPYVEDVAFQAMVLAEMFPRSKIAPYLMLVDTSRSTSIDELALYFDLRRERDASGHDRVTVTFDDRDGALARIRSGDHFLTRVDVSREVEMLRAEVAKAAENFASTLTPELTRIPPEIGIKCRSCEYRVEAGSTPSGFSECWGEKGLARPHVLDLTNLGDGAVGEYVQERIAAGACALTELDVSRLVGRNGTAGPTHLRQRDQVMCARDGRELVRGALGDALRQCAYPLRFIDFEVSQLCVPYHANMRPYEKVAFQWSCHTIASPDAEATHVDWINTESRFPNFLFARTLCDEVKKDGTVFMWHHFERVVLEAIRRQMVSREHHDPGLEQDLSDLVSRLRDQKKICAEHYLHPGMEGSNSIKRVLDAIWRTDPQLRADFHEYAEGDASPYEALPPVEIDGETVQVAEGVAAMRAYQDMLYGPARHDPDEGAKLRELLRRYCRLDTAAMVMIWHHWLRITE